MSGMQMLMASLGLDPQMIMQSAEQFKDGLARLNNDLAIIKAQNETILMLLSVKNTSNVLPFDASLVQAQIDGLSGARHG